MNLLWSYGENWADLTPFIAAGDVTAVTFSYAVHLISPDHVRVRMPGLIDFPGDARPFMWTTLDVATPCGITFDGDTVTYVKTSRLLAMVEGHGHPRQSLLAEVAPLVAIYRSRGRWEVPAHPHDPCGARNCLRLESPP